MISKIKIETVQVMVANGIKSPLSIHLFGKKYEAIGISVFRDGEARLHHNDTIYLVLAEMQHLRKVKKCNKKVMVFMN